MADIVVLKERLSEAEEALHQFSMGKRAVSVTDRNGEQVRFEAGSAGELRAYIAALRAEIAGYGRSNRPMTVFF